eukprot:snap_masked-scaffold_1-processed-gene-11.12-mRNA-1 protein AED:1.00 eAED:1.00 QI:0/0/0/0/1/1/2/0/61
MFVTGDFGNWKNKCVLLQSCFCAESLYAIDSALPGYLRKIFGVLVYGKRFFVISLVSAVLE